MDNIVDLRINKYDKDLYPKVIDIDFNYINPIKEEKELSSVDDFFDDYDRLFFDIPTDGEFGSHKELIKRSTEYIGETLNTDREDLLLDEINQLRLELIETKQIIDDLTK